MVKSNSELTVKLTMKKIPLTQGKFAIVDDCDYDYLMQWEWRYTNTNYAARYNTNNRTLYMHRAMLKRMGFKDFVFTDHVNRNTLDNRRCNLRPATNRQSGCNRGKLSNNTSGYIGVSWYKHTQKWQACIRVNRKLKHLGYYSDPKDAARAYNKAALKYHGEFAVLNEVE